MIPVEALFEQHEWAAEQLEPGIWRATFTTEREEEYDLYVMATETAARFAVTPFVTCGESADANRVARLLLLLNPMMEYVYFGFDEDGDIMLLADLPARLLDYEAFGAIVDAMTEATSTLAYEIRRMVYDPDYHSPVLPEV